jgi:surface protein
MATLNDLDVKRAELNTAIDDYKQAVLDFSTSTITQQALDDAKALAIATGDEYAKLISQVKQDDPTVTNDDQLFSRPAAMNALVRDDIATILRTGRLFGDGMKLLVDTEGTAGGATNVILSFATGSDVTIDWGDGSEIQAFTGAASHDYSTPGQYTVEVHGTINGFTNPLVESQQQLKDVMQWGEVEFASAQAMFARRTGFVISASDGPTFLPGASCAQMFYSATNFNSNINHWDTSNVVDMTSMFLLAYAFNQPLAAWDVSGVVSIAYMFKSTNVFNQDISGWDVSSVLTMTDTFRQAGAFNGAIGGWNVSQVINMEGMFNRASVFNQPLNNWNVGSVTNMRQMFNFASAFNQYIKGWDVSNVTSYASFADYSSLLSTNAPNFT